MAKVIALYKHPADPAAFDSYYFKKHVPITKKIPVSGVVTRFGNQP